jgi:hypothetical protein
MLAHFSSHGVEGRGGTAQGRSILQHADHEDVALVLGRRERGRHAAEQTENRQQHDREHTGRERAALHHEAHALLVPIGHAREPIVEAAQNPMLVPVLALEHQRAQRRCQRQRDEARDHDRYRDGYGELPVHLADQTA